MKISVSMIVKNEREMITRCLRSVETADEIVILDTGSTDDTAEIVAALNLPNVRYIAGEYEWSDHFAEARNEANMRCSHPWILTIDADEYLQEGGMDKLRDCIASHRNVKAFNLRVQQHGGEHWHDSPRLARNLPEFAWQGAAHNFQPIPNAVGVEVTLFYDSSPAHKQDPDRTLRILTRELIIKPTDQRTLYYLASEWYRRRHWNAALMFASASIEMGSSGYYMAESYLLKARCLWQNRKGEEARLACFRALEYNAHFREAAAFMAEMSFTRNQSPWLAMSQAGTNENVIFKRA